MKEGTDTRFSLTDWEKDSVIRLRDACVEEGIQYKSIFELAKYVLVTKSMADDSDPKADEKRLKSALKRLRKRRNWELKHGLSDMDPVAALYDLLESEPNYFVGRYIRDKEGHSVVGHHLAFAPTEFLFSTKENKAKYLIAEQLRFELAAPDMDEARQGVGMVCIANGKLTLPRALKYLKMLSVARENLQDMHCHRIRRIYGEVPGFLGSLVKHAVVMLPKKIANRLVVFSKVADLEEYIDKVHDTRNDQANVPVREWIRDRLSVYEETTKRLSI